MENYGLTLWGLWAMGAMLMLQTMVAAVAHRKQAKYVPGIVDGNLSHESFVFRSHRTFMNSLENVPMMLIPALVGLFARMDPMWLGGLLWVFIGGRVVHMVLYYVIATEKNPSPRSYFYTVSLLANLVLLGKLAGHLASL